LGGKDGVYALKGFSKYLYNRDANGWRDKTIFKFDDKAVTKVTVQNEHGNFVFEKKDDKWTSQYAEKEKDKPKEIADFKSSKIDDLVRAYKGLNASSFADGKPLSEVGLEKPVATVTLELTGGTGKYVLTVGGTSEGSSRWVQANTGPQVYSVSSWTADWATAEVSKFQEKKDDKKDKDKAEADPHAGMPGMPPGMAGMPPGMQGMPEEPEE
jgi:hypothetical protein